jgi:DNA polymerase-3 subunit epsilon
VLLERLGPFLRAAHTHPRLVRADGPEGADLLWIVGGRVVDWGPCPAPAEVLARTDAALRARVEPYVPADEVHELRIVSTWLAAQEPPVLDLAPRPGDAELIAFAGAGTPRPATAPPTLAHPSPERPAFV